MNTNSSYTTNQNQPQITMPTEGNATTGNSPGFFMKRLWFFSGANVKVLERCQVDHDKYAAIGFAILLTSILASISGGYAFWTVFNSTFMAGVFGGFWGLTIGSLDRFLVSTMRKEKKMSERQLFITSIRITIAIVIAIVVVKPLEMKIFEKPIQLKLTEQHDKEAKDYQESLRKTDEEILKNSIVKDKLSIQVEKEKLDKEQKEAYEAFIAETEGTSGSLKQGDGPISKEKRQKYQQALKQFQEYQKKLKILEDKKDTKIAQLDSERATKVQKFREQQDKTNDIMTQFVTLHELGESKPLYALASKFITLVFILLDVTPILAKILLDETPYDVSLKEESDKQILFNQSSLKLEQFKQLANDDSELELYQSYLNFDKERKLLKLYQNSINFDKERELQYSELEKNAFQEIVQQTKNSREYKDAIQAAMIKLISNFHSNSDKWSHGATAFSRSSGNTANANTSNGQKN